MTAIPTPINTIAALVDAEHEAKRGEPRAHLGASQIGHACERKVWLDFRWAVPEKFPGRILRVFRRGQNEEATVYSDLEAAGLRVEAFDPETKRQWWFSDGHFSGSCDGIVRGVPEAPKAHHLLEIKTHSLKSFSDLAKQGVKKSKPQHYAQMQVYMRKFQCTRGLYYAVCKDDDNIYTERVELDLQVADGLIAKAKRLIASDRMPPPLSADPTWFECKWCAGHDLCHGSKTVREVHCRTCAHWTAEADGRSTCAHWGADIPSVDAQRAGCDAHILHPDMVPWAYEPSERGVVWLTPHGRVENGPTAPAYTSREIVANVAACAGGLRDAWLEQFPEARVVG